MHINAVSRVIFLCGIYNTIFMFRITFSKYVNSKFAQRLVPLFVYNEISLLKGNIDVIYHLQSFI